MYQFQILRGRIAIAACLVLWAILLQPIGAAAEPVTYTFTGTVNYVSDGTDPNHEIDLTGMISLGQPVVFSYTVERNMAPSYIAEHIARYDGATSVLGVSIGGYNWSVAVSASIEVRNDYPPGYVLPDVYFLLANGSVSPPLGGHSNFGAHIQIEDQEGTVFQSTEQPREMPPIAEFERRVLEFYFSDPNGDVGFVRTDVTEVTTPALPGSWGRIKARYRD